MNNQLNKKVFSQRMVVLKGHKQLVLAQTGFKAVFAMKGLQADLRETQLLLQTNETFDTWHLEILRK